jgi:hypothetical protein
VLKGASGGAGAQENSNSQRQGGAEPNNTNEYMEMLEGVHRGSQSQATIHKGRTSGFTDSSTDCYDPANDSHTRYKRSEVPDEFQRVQRRGSRPGHPQWVHKGPVNAALNTTQGGMGSQQPRRDGQVTERATTQGSSPRVTGTEEHSQPHPRLSVPSPNNVEEAPVPAPGAEDSPTGSHQVDTQPMAARPMPPSVEVGDQSQIPLRRSPVARQLNHSLDINRVFDISTVEELQANEVMQPTGMMPSATHRSIDLNLRQSNIRSFSEGTGGTNFPPNISVRTPGGDFDMVFTSTPSTPRTSDSVVPAHLMAEYREWLRERHGLIAQARVQSPQATRLANQVILRRNFMGDASRQHRSRMMEDRRLSRRSVSAGAPRPNQIFSHLNP